MELKAHHTPQSEAAIYQKYISVKGDHRPSSNWN